MLGGTLYGVLTAEAKLARKAIGPILDDPPPDPSGWYGRGRPGPAVKLVVLGDSSAAGYGVARVEETPGALLASGVAEHAERRVYLRDLAVVGAKSSDLAEQVDKALPIQPDVAPGGAARRSGITRASGLDAASSEGAVDTGGESIRGAVA